VIQFQENPPLFAGVADHDQPSPEQQEEQQMLRCALYVLALLVFLETPSWAKWQVEFDPATAADLMWIRDLAQKIYREQGPVYADAVGISGATDAECPSFNIRGTERARREFHFEAVCVVPFNREDGTTTEVAMSLYGIIGNEGRTIAIFEPPALKSKVVPNRWIEPDYAMLGLTLSNTIRKIVEQQKQRLSAP
jgi:hypothetical protein